MKFKILAIACAFLCVAAVSNASITEWVCSSDGDGVIDCIADLSGSSGVYQLSITGTQNEAAYGHMEGSFTTDTALDPTINVTNSLDNDTDYIWTDYHVNIYMNKEFTLVANSASVIIPGDWTAFITAVTYDETLNQYVGSIDYYAGTGVAVNDTLQFTYQISYASKGTITYTQEMWPTPEPSTFVMLACGLLGVLHVRRRIA